VRTKIHLHDMQSFGMKPMTFSLQITECYSQFAA
jgi:hypothetical protein